MSTKRKLHSARFKAKVALEAYKGDKGDKTASEFISADKISSGQVSSWKKVLVDGVLCSYLNQDRLRLLTRLH